MAIVLLIGVLLISEFQMTISEYEQYAFLFPNESSYASVSYYESLFEPWSKVFTVCFRVKQTRSRATYLSYASPYYPNNILIESYDNLLELWVKNVKMRFDTGKRVLNKFVHYCFSWNADDGIARVILDGDVFAENVFNQSKDGILLGQGHLVIGQKQAMGTGSKCEVSSSFTGIFTDLEIWNRVISEYEAIYTMANSLRGDALRWNCTRTKWNLKGIEMINITIPHTELTKCNFHLIPNRKYLSKKDTCESE